MVLSNKKICHRKLEMESRFESQQKGHRHCGIACGCARLRQEEVKSGIRCFQQ
jgi:hypothetical protein